MVSKTRLHSSQTNLPSSSVAGLPVAPERYRPEHAEQSVPLPSGPGPFPDVSSSLQLHQQQRHMPPSHHRLCTPSAEKVSKVRLQSSQGYLPSSVFEGGALWPERYLLEQTAQRVWLPSGPGPLPEVSSNPQLHQPQRHAPPSHLRLWDPIPEMVSKTRLHSSQTNLPSSSVTGLPVAPERKRLEQAEQSVLAPSGPGPFPWVSSAPQLHQLHRHTPPSQKRRWLPSARRSEKPRRQWSQHHSPLSFCPGIELYPARYRAEQVEQRVFCPFGPFALWCVSAAQHLHHSHCHAQSDSQKRP